MEKDLIARGELTLVRENQRFRYYSGKLCNLKANELVHTTEYCHSLSISDTNKNVYYRHMAKEQFQHLVDTNQVDMVDSKAYVAITNEWSYCNKYLTGMKRNGHSVTHIVEFYILDGIDLTEQFQKVAEKELGLKNLQPKIEDGAFSWGLGPQCRKGVLGKEFNRLLFEGKIIWRLVNFQEQKRIR